MTLDEFKVLGEAWGSDIERWPEHLRAAAATVARTREATAILAEEQQIDRLIAAAKPEVSADRSAGVIFSVVTAIAAADRATELPRKFRWPWWLRPAASVICAAVLGASLGVVTLLHGLFGPAPTPALTMILDPWSFDWVLR
jgi:hypothetical protein